MTVRNAAAAVSAPAAGKAPKDWTYLVEKAPSDLHVDLAAFIAEETGTDLAEVDPVKFVQFVLALHGTWQKTDRVARRRRTEASIAKGGATIVKRFGDVLAEAEKAATEEVAEAEAPKPTPAKRTRKAPAAKAAEAK